ncbi:phage integrase N-terminal SAM-like domain-containing protein [Hydrogenophaga sp. NH-16]|uniref:tyrosine-type recombinase/integrase n=1 Tax=Hydrogenophaga sp. NH-16 TaxID=2184519 RepID=UPI001F4DD7AE|nr:phage integrase N-terminal SAM-like domain-containing protein [Hydrogenophaga sp. NH-16]
MDVSTPTPSAAVSPLRQRMLEDMRMRQFAEHTQEGYIRAVRKLATFLGRSPHTATAEDLRRFQLHLVDTGTGPVTINATITGLKFFFDITLGRPELMLKMTHVAVPRKLPVILSPEEVGRLIAAAPNLKHQAAMSVAYGAGLRVSEVVSLKVGDIDGERMTLRVEQGKGRKDRYAMLSPVLLERLTTLEHRRSTRRWTWRPVGCCVRRLVSVCAGSAKSSCRIEVAHRWAPAVIDAVSMLSRRLPTRDPRVEQSP